MVDGHHCTAREIVRTPGEHALEEIRELLASQALDSDPHDRRCGRIRKDPQGMKICVERDDDLSVLAGVLQDLDVGCRGEADIARVDSVDATLAKSSGGATRQALVEQELHALLGMSSTLSSTASAA
jgi:hypothetical protein